MTLGLRLFMAIEVTLCYFPGTLLRLSPFLKLITSKQKKTLAILYHTLFLGNMLLLFCGLRDFETSTALIRLDMLLIQIALVLVNIIIIKGYRREHLFTFGVVAICMYMLLSSATYISELYWTEISLYQYLFGTGVYILFMILWYFPIRSMLKKTVSPFLSHKCLDYWKNVWYIPVLLYISMFVSLPVDQNLESLTMLLSRLFVSISGVIVTRTIAENHKTILEKQTLTEQLNYSKLHYTEMQTKVETARKVRHDLKHFLHAIRKYIETNDKAGLADFCDMVEEKQLVQMDVPYTGCTIVDGVLYHYIKRADAHKIHFKYQGNLKHDGIADLDFCVLIGNALENAFDACLTVEENRFVTLSAEHDGDIWSVMIQNSFDGRVDMHSERVFSRKREQRVGVGLETIRAVCEKYNGTMKLDWNSNTFTIFMILTANSKIK